jgi:hypothetical protein
MDNRGSVKLLAVLRVGSRYITSVEILVRGAVAVADLAEEARRAVDEQRPEYAGNSIVALRYLVGDA